MRGPCLVDRKNESKLEEPRRSLVVPLWRCRRLEYLFKDWKSAMLGVWVILGAPEISRKVECESHQPYSFLEIFVATGTTGVLNDRSPGPSKVQVSCQMTAGHCVFPDRWAHSSGGAPAPHLSLDAAREGNTSSSFKERAGAYDLFGRCQGITNAHRWRAKLAELLDWRITCAPP